MCQEYSPPTRVERFTRYVARIQKAIRQWHRQATCDHSHTFRCHLQDAHWLSSGELKGKHPSINICGCYICGKTWCEDYGA